MPHHHVFLPLYLIAMLVITDAFTFFPPKSVQTRLFQAANEAEDLTGIFRPGPYVPSGLTAEQYQQLKQQEAEKLQKMDFGAWGPRFKRSDRPDGDWLLQPKLWSMGFSANNPSFTSTKSPIGRRLQRIRTVVTRNMQPSLLLFVCLHVLASALRLARSTSSLRTSASIFWTFHPIQCSCLLGISILFSPLAASWLEWSSRRRLWTTRRMSIVSASLSLLAYLLWTATVMGIRTIL